MAVVAGVDFGTLSVRVSLVDSDRGLLASAVAEYPLHRKREDPEFATQSHVDHMKALASATREAVKKAGAAGDQVCSIALDTTGSSVIPVGKNLQPLDDYYLWCDHRAKAEAAEITEAARSEKLQGEYATSDQLAGHLSAEWAEQLGLKAGIPIPVGAFDAHWDAIGAGCRSEDIVNVVGTSTCIIGITPSVKLVPGVCGVVQGSVHPKRTGIEAGLSAVGDIFQAIATRAGTDVKTLSQGLEKYRAGQTGLLRMTWDNGDRTVLVNPNLRGITFGWNLQTTAQDELFAAIEGTALHTRVILERMEQNGVTVRRVINAGGIPQKNDVLNQVYANVLGRPVLVPAGSVVSLGSAIFAFLAAGTFKTVEQAQDKICPKYRTFEPDPSSKRTYDKLYALFSKVYFAFGQPETREFGSVLPELIRLAESEQAKSAN